MLGLPWRAHQWCLDRFRETEENGQLVTTGVIMIGRPFGISVYVR